MLGAFVFTWISFSVAFAWLRFSAIDAIAAGMFAAMVALAIALRVISSIRAIKLPKVQMSLPNFGRTKKQDTESLHWQMCALQDEWRLTLAKAKNSDDYLLIYRKIAVLRVNKRKGFQVWSVDRQKFGNTFLTDAYAVNQALIGVTEKIDANVNLYGNAGRRKSAVKSL